VVTLLVLALIAGFAWSLWWVYRQAMGGRTTTARAQSLDTPPVASHEARLYVQALRAQGRGDAEIRTALIQAGWSPLQAHALMQAPPTHVDHCTASAPVAAAPRAPVPAPVFAPPLTQVGAPLPVAATPDGCWLPAGREVTVAGRRMAGGMVYVGSGLRSVGRYGQTEPALIDPALPVGAAPDVTGLGMGYWPSYDGIPRECRAAYLDWLATGRDSPDTYIGYVFLYFYGLERRILADARNSAQAAAETPALLAEVQRLLGVYGAVGSFRGYAEGLLDFAQASLSADPVRGYDPLEQVGREATCCLRVGLAQMVVASQPIPWNWALAWYCATPEGYLRTPATRCQAEFRVLFRLRYARRSGDGLRISPNKSLLKLTYHPASLTFGGEITVEMGALPDVTRQTAPLRKIAQIVDECQTELDAYSRWLGRNPTGRGTLAAAALLPGDLVAETGSDEVATLRASLDELLGASATTVITAGSLMERWPSADGARFGKRNAVGLAQALAKCGYGMEPDVRFGGAAPKPGDALVLFRLPEHSPAAPTESYLAAMFVLRLFIALALADGKVSDAEHEQLVAYLKATARLSSAERERLRAYVRWLVRTKPGLAGLKRHAEALSPQQRHALGRLLIAVAGADGVIAAPEVAALAKIYPLIGLDPDEVHSDIHALAASGAPSEPVTVCAPQPTTSRFAVPQPSTPPEGEASTVTLDMERVRATLAETEHLAVVLDGIFVEEEPAPCPVAQDVSEMPCVAGLDAVHSALLRRLAGHAAIDRAAFDGFAAECCVLPDGALDTLNDAALGACEELLCEGDDPIEVSQTVLREMLA